MKKNKGAEQQYCFDELFITGINNPIMKISGWVHSTNYKIEIKSNDKLITTIDKNNGEYDREDLSIMFDGKDLNNTYGFSKNVLLTNDITNIDIYLIDNGVSSKVRVVSNSKAHRYITRIKRLIKRIIYNINYQVVLFLKYIYKFLRMPKAIFNKKIRKSFTETYKFMRDIKSLDFNEINQYNKWINKYEYFSPVETLSYNPLISIVIPCYNPDEQFLKECIDSILNQTYQNFEICIADDCSPKEYVKKVLKEYEKLDKRIKVIYREKNGNISAATNSAISIANGEFIGLVDNDDILMPNALYENVKALNDNRNLDLIYSDEDKLDLDGRRCLPHFKADYSPDTLLSMNYITHFAVLRTSIVNDIGGFRTRYDGAQDYDMFLRFTEHTTSDRIYHISKILYNWRMSLTSTALNMDSKSYAGQAGCDALQDALNRRGIKGTAYVKELTIYYVKYNIDKNDKVSIIIPTKDKIDILDKCITSIFKHTDKSLFEIIIVDNNSSEVETHKYFNDITKKYGNIKIITDNGDFNYSRINNEASKVAENRYLLLLNNDIEIIEDNWLETMMGYAKQNHIGAVGVKLEFPNKTLQHAGVVLGLGPSKIAGHAFPGKPASYCGCYGRTRVPYNYAGVTAACLMIDKNKFIKAGMFDENLSVSYNDVDLCLSILKAGYYNVFLPQVTCIHYESISRGYDNTYEKVERTCNEIDYMRNKWGDILTHDPFYNVNYSLHASFMLNTDKNRK